MSELDEDMAMRTLVRELWDDSRAVYDHMTHIVTHVSLDKHKRGRDVQQILQDQREQLRAIEQKLLLVHTLLKDA